MFTREFELCPICEWQQDNIQEDDYSLAGGLNKLSVNQYKLQWETQQAKQDLIQMAIKYPSDRVVLDRIKNVLSSLELRVVHN